MGAHVLKLRRAIALCICPEIDQARSMRFSSLGADGEWLAAEVQHLDEVLSVHLGHHLEWRDIKPAIGVPAVLNSLSEREAYKGMVVIRKVRPGTPPSIGELAHQHALLLFSEIWPEDLSWPQHLPRLTADDAEPSTPSKKDAA